jgi:hypothetical protein
MNIGEKGRESVTYHASGVESSVLGWGTWGGYYQSGGEEGGDSEELCKS